MDQSDEPMEVEQSPNHPWSGMTFAQVVEHCNELESQKAARGLEKRLKPAREKRLNAILKRQPKDRLLSPDKNAEEEGEVGVTRIRVDALIKARAEEIEMTERAVNSGPEKVALLQRMPISMRRRQMSHNTKRIPHFIRPNNENDFTRTKAQRVKRNKFKKHVCSKHSRRSEFLCRQLKFRWLESHLWHAKRFKMVTKWGFKIPYHSNDKILRPLHRNINDSTVMTDLSYYCWVELFGHQGKILQALQSTTNPAVSRGFGASDFLSGNYQGQTILYYPGKYPYECVGPVDFMWNPIPETLVESSMDRKLCSQTPRKLWLCFHPSLKLIIYRCLKTAISGTGISFRSLERDLNCIEFTGNQTLSILKHCLKISAVVLQHSEKYVVNKNDTIVKRNKSFWWSKMYDDENLKKTVEKQKHIWSSVCETDVMPGRIFGLLIRDPRLAYPAKLPANNNGDPSSNQVTLSSSNQETVKKPKPTGSLSPASFIWDEDVRDYVMTRRMGNSQVNRIRSSQLPFTEIPISDEEARVPVLLVKCRHDSGLVSGGGRTGYNTVWQLILPRNWMMPFWSVLRRVRIRAYGLRERELFVKRAKCLTFPFDFLDTAAGYICHTQRSKSLHENMLKKPTSKRFNFERFGIDNPYLCDFNCLIAEPTPDTASMEGVELNPVLLEVTTDGDENPLRKESIARRRTEIGRIKQERKRKAENRQEELTQKLELSPELTALDARTQSLLTSVAALPVNPDLTPCVTLPSQPLPPVPEKERTLAQLAAHPTAGLLAQMQLPYYLMRERRVLDKVDQYLRTNPVTRKASGGVVETIIPKDLRCIRETHAKALVMVHLTLLSRGTFTLGSTVLVPSEDDLKADLTGHCPNIQGDHLKPVRKRLSKKQKKKLNKSNSLESEVIGKISEESKKTKYNAHSRELMGYVTFSEYDLSLGGVIATGVCCLKTILGGNFSHCCGGRNGAVVLLNNPGENIFRFARMQLINSS